MNELIERINAILGTNYRLLMRNGRVVKKCGWHFITHEFGADLMTCNESQELIRASSTYPFFIVEKSGYRSLGIKLKTEVTKK